MKKIIIFILILIALFSCSNVFAEDNVTNNIVQMDDANYEIIEQINVDTNALGDDESSVGTFTELANKINNASDEFTLTKNYIYNKNDSGCVKGISINKKITINGNGFYISGNNEVPIFTISSENVILNNISFMNSKDNAIYWNADKGTINNCLFMNNSAKSSLVHHKDSGASIFYYSSNYCSVINCKFENNNAISNGGAIRCEFSNFFSIINSTFENNTAFSSGGALDIHSSNNSLIVNSTFIKNEINSYNRGNGGGICAGGCNNLSINNCKFLSNYAHSGGAIMGTTSSKYNIINCTFDNNTANSGGAVQILVANNFIYNCNFTNNLAGYGGAIETRTDNTTIFNCQFLNNTATSFAGALHFLLTDSVNIYYSNFLNNNARSGCGAILSNNNLSCYYSHFENNSVNRTNSSIIETGSYTKFINCTFINNSSNGENTIVILNRNYTCITNCIFINKYSKNKGFCLKFEHSYFGLINNTYFYPEDNQVYLNNSNVEFIKQKSYLIAENISINYNNSSDFIATLYNNINNESFINQPITIILNNNNITKTFTKITNMERSIILNNELNELNIGEWKGNLFFKGNNNYYPCNLIFTIIIKPSVSYCILDELNSTYGKPITLIAHIVDNNNLNINEGTVVFFDEETNIGQSNVNNGVVYLRYIPISAGDHNITAIYNSSNYLASRSSTVVTVEKSPTNLYSSNLIATYSIKNELIAILKDNFGNPLSGIQISVNLNGIKYFNTDANGKIKVSIKGLSPKNYNAVIKFAGNSNYVKSTITVKVTIKKATPKLNAKAKTFKKSLKIKKYSISLKNNFKKVMKNIKVTLKIKGKIYSAKTNKKGVAIFKLKKLTKRGTFKSVVTYKGDKYYNKVTKKVNIKIK